MDKFDLYKVDSKYINYLRQYDRNVCEPKDFGHTKPYVGIMVFESKDYYWFAPLTSKTNKPEFYCVKLYDEDNHANQCNPNNDEYWHSRDAGSQDDED